MFEEFPEQCDLGSFLRKMEKAWLHKVGQFGGLADPNYQLSEEERREMTGNLGFITMNYFLLAQAYQGRMPDEKGEILLRSLLEKMGHICQMRETGDREICKVVSKAAINLRDLGDYIKTGGSQYTE